MKRKDKPVRDRSALVMRSMHFFEEDDKKLRMLAAERGVTKSDIVRGLLSLALDEIANVGQLNKEATNVDILQDAIKAGRINR